MSQILNIVKDEHTEENAYKGLSEPRQQGLASQKTKELS